MPMIEFTIFVQTIITYHHFIVRYLISAVSSFPKGSNCFASNFFSKSFSTGPSTLPSAAFFPSNMVTFHTSQVKTLDSRLKNLISSKMFQYVSKTKKNRVTPAKPKKNSESAPGNLGGADSFPKNDRPDSISLPDAAMSTASIIMEFEE